ncbi:hypothetical protein AHF37_01890 [Paragonimus kellicotti]|nr:hypothetical protein AHF37_01890 [Paragonimus kellicotti]
MRSSEMESRETYALRVCGPMITQNLDPIDVLDSLFSERWISDSEYRQLLALCTKQLLREASMRLLELLRLRTSAFECFVRALEAQNSFLAVEIRKHYEHAPDGIRREHSLSDLRETLIDGAVPDLPVHHINRRDLFESLSNSLRTLASHFRIGRNDDPTGKLADLTLGRPNSETGSLLPFAMAADLQSDWQPPPTNAWLLVYGMAGCGKTVLCTSTLRRNPGLLTEYFPGGVFWLQVGSLTSPSQTPTFTAGTSAVPHSLTSQLISLIDRLERKVLPPTRYSVGECHWSDSPHNTPPMSQSPPSGFSPGHLVPSLHESSERLRRALMKRQQRTTWGPDNGDRSITSLALVVLDDVWDVEVGRVLSSMPAAFLVTSRDQKVLQHVETPVDLVSLTDFIQFPAGERPIRPSAPPPICTAVGFPTVSPSGQFPSLSSLATLTRGIPFAVTLLGHLLGEHYHRISDYFCDPTGSGQQLPNWRVISRPSAYGYDTVFATVHKSVAHLSVQTQCFYSQLVIFDADVLLIPKVAAILWGTNEEVAECVLSELTRFSLAKRLWVQTTRCYGYYIHALLLDVLKVSIGATKQAPIMDGSVTTYTLHSIAAPANLCIIVLSGQGRLDANVRSTSEPPVDNVQSELVVSLPSVYFLKRAENHLFLDCSRQLRLPALDLDSPMYRLLCQQHGCVRTLVVAVSSDAQLVASALQDGHIWIYSLERIGWLACISTQVAVSFAAMMTDLSTTGKKPLNTPRNKAYHAQFVSNYEHHCSGRWSRLVSTVEYHAYFWHQATEHVYKSGRLDRLVDLMINLEFLRGRLAVLGSSLVIAEFNRYRAVFATLGRMSEWNAYLRFIQTNAYFVIDPVVVLPTERGRSPYRTNTRSDSSWSLDSSSPAHRTDYAPIHTSKPLTAARTIASNLGPKGLDLIQLGLGLPQNSPVFQQALHWLLKQHQLAGSPSKDNLTPKKNQHIHPAKHSHVSEYYWFWCNSHVAASQLVWAIPTGPQAVTCLSVELPLDKGLNNGTDHSPVINGEHEQSHLSRTHPLGFRKRFLAATRGGRVLLLDAVSGYEVAVQQTYPPDVEVKFLSFLSNNTECLTCGSDGSLVVSTLPSAEPIEPLNSQTSGDQHDHDTIAVEDSHHVGTSPNGYHGDLMGGLDVDELLEDNEFNTLSPKRPIGVRLDVPDVNESWSVDAPGIGWNTGRRSSAPTTIFALSGIKVKSPTVLAEIPRLTEVVRVDGNRTVASALQLWNLPDTVPHVEAQLATPQSVRALSKPSLSLNSVSVADVLCLDACLLAGQYVLAGGTTNGRVLFLFRAQQLTRISEHVDDRAFAFQEITFKPSQPLYWRPPRRPAIVVRPWGLHPEPPSDVAVTSPSPEPSVQAGKDTAPDRIAVRSFSVPPTDKHWILTSGLTGSIHGRATAVSFLSSGLWVAVGFSTGLVLTFSLHFDEVHLYGIVKRYCLVDSRWTSESTRSKLQSVDRVVHLHTWQSEPRPDGSVTLVVLAVFASGSVTFWHIGSATHDLSTFDSGCVEVSPAGFWLPMHNVDSADPSGRLRKLSDLEVQSRVLFDTDLTEFTVPIVWSSLRRIPHLSTFADEHSSKIPQTPDRVRHILVWLTAGVDGLVFGRQVVLPSTDLVTDEVTKRPNRTFPPWRLDLEAHRPWVITDADVDPTGKWLVTASTDKTAKVWSLESGVSVFETAKHPACVRTVCFRPVLDASICSSGEEWFIATGDDAGALRIWSLTSHTYSAGLRRPYLETFSLQSCSKSGQLRRCLLYTSLNVDRPSPSEHIGNSSFVTSVRPPTRLPSPDFKPDHISSGLACTRASHIPPRFHSNAAGAGGTWLRRLVWSPDGRLLTGLSDRVCVWPFEPAAAHPTNVHDNYTSDPIPGSHVQTTSYPPFQQPRHLLHRCRVLRVLSSGVSDVTNSSLNLLMVSPRRQLTVCSPNTDNNSHDLPSYLSEMPPTLVTVDANTGTLYIFDPIGALFCSELAQ